jgi:uncharacterized membrane-anchored protein YhcB (DUF1043 family)
MINNVHDFNVIFIGFIVGMVFGVMMERFFVNLLKKYK